MEQERCRTFNEPTVSKHYRHVEIDLAGPRQVRGLLWSNSKAGF